MLTSFWWRRCFQRFSSCPNGIYTILICHSALRKIFPIMAKSYLVTSLGIALPIFFHGFFLFVFHDFEWWGVELFMISFCFVGLGSGIIALDSTCGSFHGFFLFVFHGFELWGVELFMILFCFCWSWARDYCIGSNFWKFSWFRFVCFSWFELWRV
jgi:hypothetical protein